MKKYVFVYFLLVTLTPCFAESRKLIVDALTGNDLNDGSAQNPFKTISKAAALAEAGDTVYVREGIYRERVSPPRGGTVGKNIVYMAEPQKNVVIKGSDLWNPVWTKEQLGVYYAIPNEFMFNDNCYIDNNNPFKVKMAATPYRRDGSQEIVFGYTGDATISYTLGQVFVDGQMYEQKPFKSEMLYQTKTWFYDKPTGNIFIHFENDLPNNHQVEISTRRRIFAPHKRGLGYITVQGFVMEHCGNQYPALFWRKTEPQWQQAGALGTRSGHHWVIKNNMIRYACGIGIDCGNEGDSTVDLEIGSNGLAINAGYHIIDSNYITDNGAGGTAAYFPTNITFTNNVVERNNNLHFFGSMRWESAGIKMHRPDNSIFSNNLIRNNYEEWGFWLDQGPGTNTIVSNNLIVGNKYGFDLEIGEPTYTDKFMFVNNVLINNALSLSMREAGGVTALNNIIIGSSKYAIINTINNKRTGSWQGSNNHFFNNILLNNKKLYQICPPDYYRSADRQFNNNLYSITEQRKPFEIFTLTDSLKFADWKARWTLYNNGVNYDQSSRLVSDYTCQYDDQNLVLTLSVGNEFLIGDVYNHSKRTTDYFGNSILNALKVLHGPFQNLVPGRNDLKLWNGLKPLAVNEMPTFDFFNSLRNIAPNLPELKYIVRQNKLTILALNENRKIDIYSINGYKIISKLINNNSEICLKSGIYIVNVLGYKPTKIDI